MVDLVVILAKGHSPEAPTSLSAAIAPLGVSLAPQHRGATDPELSRYYLVRNVDAAQADEAIGRLTALPDVEAAYVQPTAFPAAP